jgi:hypothetical protein
MYSFVGATAATRTAPIVTPPITASGIAQKRWSLRGARTGEITTGTL